MKSVPFIPPRPKIPTESHIDTDLISNFTDEKGKSLNQEWSENIKNIDYDLVFNSSKTRYGSQTLIPSNSNDQVDVLEFFKKYSYTDCIYAEEIHNLLKEYSNLESSAVTHKSRIVDRLYLIKKHLE